jgi:hypothetical protein
MIYFYFHTYFVVENVMHGNSHLGVSDDEAVERFIRILCHGVWRSPAKAQAKAKQPHRTREQQTTTQVAADLR